ncbi:MULTISPECIES: L,D-transpeptidase [Mesorhizobium]|uniref:L,D-transpeptidase n=2 Tax=Mesorhizobium denitrificans TaxID=2294114 RepID=A0A371XHU0_9HYPH|nr:MULTISPECIES: L,D-transpeptidase [Mesorhizobium]RFC68787.1 L,D-transpeptidase [Mesorhizobium denitrificans]
MTKLFTASMDRRRFLSFTALGVSSVALAGCATGPMYPDGPAPTPLPPPPTFEEYSLMYGPLEDGGFQIPAVPYTQIDQQFLRQVVANTTGQKPGTIVVDTLGHNLYFTLPGGQAVRYGVGLGRAGFEWAGAGVIQWKQKWPKWTPPDEMIARDPKLEKFSVRNGGQPGGLKNPLGARALYIFQNGEDTLFRVHGTPEWKSIGKSVSSGCVRMINQDVIDLYERVPNKTPIVVVNGLGSPIVEDRLPSSMPIDSGVPVGSTLIGPA